MSAQPSAAVANVLARLANPKRSGKGWVAHCPAHEDGSASLSIHESAGGNALVHCFAGCSFDAIVAATGLPLSAFFADTVLRSTLQPAIPMIAAPTVNRREVTRYRYQDRHGNVRYMSVRYSPKDFRLLAADGLGAIGGEPRLLFRLPDVLEAVAAGRWIVFVEGEKDVETLTVKGFVSTTIAGGVNGTLPEDMGVTLTGAKIAIIPDNDPAGRRFAERIAGVLAACAATLKVVVLPGLREKGDVSDWLADGGSPEDLRQLITQAPAFAARPLSSATEEDACQNTATVAESRTSPAPAPASLGPAAGSVSRVASGAMFTARGSTFVIYVTPSARSKQTVTVFNVDDEETPVFLDEINLRKDAERQAVLDKLPETGRDEVAGMLARLAADVLQKGENSSLEASSSARTSSAAKDDGRDSVALWPDDVDGAPFLDSLCRFLGCYMVLPPFADVVLALWLVHTFVFETSEFTPYMLVTSPVRACGKSTLLELLRHLAFRPQLTGGISAAALYRRIESARPSLLLDELDTMLSSEAGEKVRGILNTGFQRGGTYTLCDGDNHDVKDFATFCPKVLAGIGTIWDTVQSRSIPIRLERASHERHVQLTRIRGHTIGAICLPFKQQLAKLAASMEAVLPDADPIPAPGLEPRHEDVWRPLLAIADEIGGDWPERAREAAGALHAHAESETDFALLLLEDVRDLFPTHGVDGKLASSVLVAELATREDRPWPEYLNRQPISPRGVAKLLGKFHVSPKNIRFASGPAKGYELAQLVAAFAAYLPAPGLSATSATSRVSKPIEVLAAAVPENADAPVADVADKTGVSRLYRILTSCQNGVA